MTSAILLLVAGMAAGALNTLAGGGGLVTFPLLMVSLAPVAADATSAFALYPAYLTSTWASRAELGRVPRQLWLLFVPCLAGGLAGALLLRAAGNRDLIVLVPWLVFGATLLMLLRPLLAGQPTPLTGPHRRPRLLGELARLGFIFLVAVYGGFFGAGIGILMICALDLIGLDNIHQSIPLKNALSAGLRGLAVAAFIVDAKVDWEAGLPMAAGAIGGGYLAAKVAERTNRRMVRSLVLTVGFGLSAYYFWKLYGAPEFAFGGE